MITNVMSASHVNAQQAQVERLSKQGQAEAAAKAGRAEEEGVLTPKSGPQAPDVDEYVHGEEPVSPGLYRQGRDEDGNTKIYFDDPDRRSEPSPAAAADGSDGTDPAAAADGSGGAEPAVPADGPGEEEPALPADGAPGKPSGDKKAGEECTVNTDKVDAEIRKLKENKEKIEQQISRASDDPEEQKKLQKELQQVENELKMKDNDSYRRQHAEYTYH